MMNRQAMTLPDEIADGVDAALARMQAESWVSRIWVEDAHLWSSDLEHVQEINRRLGWLHLPVRALPEAEELTGFAEAARTDFDRVVLLGMGGSSLAPWCFAEVFGATAGHPELSVLDSTVPADVLACTGDTPLDRCLFIVSSKSGTTTETRSAFEHFWAELSRISDTPGDHFVVITDPATPLAELARQREVRAVYENWPDIGGRYSALSYFGLVPAALIGVPVRELLEQAGDMAGACGPEVGGEDNPAAALGAVLGVCHEMGRDKVTIVTPPEVASFGDWAEQLLAESTGKDGKGLVPVVREPMLEPEAYNDDRVFVFVVDDRGGTPDELAESLAALGHPVVRIVVEEIESLGAEMFRWEFATAVAGAIMGIDPFDQPNVQESKDKTKQVLKEYSDTGSLPEIEPDVIEGGICLFGVGPCGDVRGAVADFLAEIGAGDYFAIMAYLPRSEAVEDGVARIRSEIAEATGAATTFGYGPRFLHSTGQLHKGGPDSGVFLQLTCDDEAEVEIPGADYDYGTLVAAQAAGDFAALQAHGRRVMRVELGEDWATNLGRLAEMTAEAL